MDARLQAGPAIKRTRAAPGVSPLSISATAIGMLPVAQTYIGIAIARTSSIEAKVLPWNMLNQDSGTRTVINPATSRPMASHFPMSPIISTKAYSNASTHLAENVFFSSTSLLQDSPQHCPGSFRSEIFTSPPPNTEVSNAAIGLAIANGSPIRLYVAMMESTPVWGVAIRNETVAPFDAPSLRSDIAVGMTPHEHSGRGMPNSAALTTLLKLRSPRKRP